MQYLIEGDTLTSIADAVRAQLYTDKQYKASELSGAIDTIVNSGGTYTGSHTDAYGIWHKPEDWDDIESLPIYDNHDVVYLLYDLVDITDEPWFALNVQGYVNPTTLKWSIGHVVNGEFQIISGTAETTVNLSTSNTVIKMNLTPYVAEKYIVVRLETPSGFLSCVATTNWPESADLSARTVYYQPAVMRYGTMRGGRTATFRAYSLESDNIIDFAKLYEGTTYSINLGSNYYGNYNMQRWRNTGWNLGACNVTNISNLFYYNVCLSDVPTVTDMTGWVCANTTTIASMMNYCRAWRNTIIVKDWVFTKCTSMASAFSHAESLVNLIGIDTWTSAPICTTLSGLFDSCYNLVSPIDLSNLGLTTTLTTLGSVFSNCKNVTEIHFDNVDCTNVTTMGNIFNATQSLKILTMDNFVPPTSKCTNLTALFYNSGLPEIELNGWDFSGTNINTSSGFFRDNYSLVKLVLTNCTDPQAYNVADKNIIGNCYNLEYLDISCWDLSVYTNTTGFTVSFIKLYNLRDFYPPQNIKTPFNISDSKNLSHDSLVRLISNLATITSNYKLTISSENIAKLTSDELAVATGKGWTVA